MFFHGEDAVADDLSPFIDAAPREEQKYFLATQQVDEVRHAIFFKRFMEEVVGVGDGTIAGGLRAVEPELTWGFRKTFALLDEITGALRADRSRRGARPGGDDVPRRRRGAARPARPALHLRLPRAARPAARLPRRDEAGRAGRAAPHRLRRQAPARPRGRGAGRARRGRGPRPRGHPVLARGLHPARTGTAPTPSASASRSRRSTPRAPARSSQKLRAAGLPLESLPGPSVFPLELSTASAPSTAWRCSAPASSGPATAPRRATRPRWSCSSARSPAWSTTARRPPAVHRPVGVRGRRAVARARRQRLDRRARGPRADIDLEVRCSYEDWVDVVAGRLDPRRALATRKLRPHGSPRALWAARSLF